VRQDRTAGAVDGAETGGRAHTRRAILDAAVAVLSRNPGAALADVAAEAGVGRTTVHRYFPERADLAAALSGHVLARIEAATERARPEDGPALAALDRVCQEYFELGPVLTLLFADPQLSSSELWEAETESDRRLLRLVERGHADGTIDAQMEPAWVQELLWAVLYTTWQRVHVHGQPKHQSLGLCLRSLAKAVGAGPVG
jgi:AcrR family transcriptional regulator